MIDIHSHILPNVDDGAKSIDEALKLLCQQKAQGCTHVIATPHFYPEETNLEHFLCKLEAKWELLCDAVKDKDLPKILRGGEIHFFSHMDHCEELSKLTLGSSKYILVELPHTREITPRMVDSIVDLNLNLGLTPILAHLERYYNAKNFNSICQIVSDGYAKAQVNASSFVDSYFLRRAALALVKNGIADYIASDAHNLNRRPVKFTEAFKIINEKLGHKYTDNLLNNSDNLLEEIGMK